MSPASKNFKMRKKKKKRITATEVQDHAVHSTKK
jgi:hypothetical protein